SPSTRTPTRAISWSPRPVDSSQLTLMPSPWPHSGTTWPNSSLPSPCLTASSSRSAIAAVSSGPRLRLKESGHIVAEAMELPLVMEAGLDGPYHGEADGRPWYEVKNAFRG